MHTRNNALHSINKLMEFRSTKKLMKTFLFAPIKVISKCWAEASGIWHFSILGKFICWLCFIFTYRIWINYYESTQLVYVTRFLKKYIQINILSVFNFPFKINMNQPMSVAPACTNWKRKEDLSLCCRNKWYARRFEKWRQHILCVRSQFIKCNTIIEHPIQRHWGIAARIVVDAVHTMPTKRFQKAIVEKRLFNYSVDIAVCVFLSIWCCFSDIRWCCGATN